MSTQMKIYLISIGLSVLIIIGVTIALLVIRQNKQQESVDTTVSGEQNKFKKPTKIPNKKDSDEDEDNSNNGNSVNDINSDIDEHNLECLSAHNEKRRKHRVPDLIIDEKLILFSKKRALTLKNTDVFAHESNSKYGENLHLIGPLTSCSCYRVVNAWYNEIKDYNFANPRNSRGVIGHFTQVIWRDTERVGCAQAYSSKSKRLYTVCSYDPPGNYEGEYGENVPEI